jgi:hypothetical protein
MEINRLIECSRKDHIGKYYLLKAVKFAFNYEFGKAYEFFKEGLDVLTCDCQKDWLIPNEETNKKVFDDINVKHLQHFEYYFVKAYILSYDEAKKSLYLALEAIDKYLELKDDEYGNYVKGKILLALNEPEQAIKYFEKATLHGSNQRLLYRIGRTKEQHLKQRGLNELFHSFVQNPSSACCARVLKKYLNEQGKELFLAEDESNPLLIAFNEDEDEWLFQILYEELLKNQLEKNDPFEINPTATIDAFIQEIKNNSELFVEENLDDYITDYDDYESDYDDYDTYGNSYEKYGGYNGWSDDAIDDAFEGDPENTWNVD